MTEFSVPQMTCGHCAQSITNAILAVDAGATVDVDLGRKTVSVISSANADRLERALRDAGYAAHPRAVRS